jgi:hypothetical protein
MSDHIPERRRTRRYYFDAQAVIPSLEGAEATYVRVVGLGIAGCRIEIDRPLEVDMEFELRIDLGREEFVSNVVVRFWKETGFAGLRFTSMTEEARKRLERLVEYLASTSAQPER